MLNGFQLFLLSYRQFSGLKRQSFPQPQEAKEHAQNGTYYLHCKHFNSSLCIVNRINNAYAIRMWGLLNYFKHLSITYVAAFLNPWGPAEKKYMLQCYHWGQRKELPKESRQGYFAYLFLFLTSYNLVSVIWVSIMKGFSVVSLFLFLTRCLQKLEDEKFKDNEVLELQLETKFKVKLAILYSFVLN